MSVESVLQPTGVRVDTIDITDLMINEYELLQYNRPGYLRFNDRGYYYTFPEQPLINQDHVSILKHDEEGVEWEFNVSELGVGVDAGETQSASRSTSFKEKYKIRHEFVAESFGKGLTDRKLREVLPEEGDEDDDLSPDFLWKDYRDFYYSLEVTTTRNDTEEGLQRSYDIKAFKYRYALETRTKGGNVNKVISYAIIVVSPNSILSSIRLPKVLISELIVRMRIGIALENKAKQQGLSFEAESEELLHSAMREEISKHLRAIKFYQVGNSELLINKKYIQSVLRQPNESDVVKTYLDILLKVKDEIREERLGPDFDPGVITKYRNDLSEGNRRTTMKAVVNLPLFLPYETEDSVDIPDIYTESRFGDVETRLWSIALDNFRSERQRNIEEDPSLLLQEAFETDPEVVKFYQDKRRCQRNKYHRVEVMSCLTTSEREQLAEQGLWAKRYKRDVFYKERRKISQSPFHFDTPTNDIDEFLENNHLFDKIDTSSSQVERVMDLIKVSNDLIGNKAKGHVIVEEWTKTKIFWSMDLISDIAVELCIANKQNCKTGSGILKKLRHMDAYILIFPTKSSEHTFFSLYFPNGDILCDRPFRSPIHFNNGYVYPLVSVKQSKLENWCNASARLITMISFWSWFYEMQDDTPKSFKENVSARKMLLLSMLVHLEDKAQTEETITISRYMYMECFKGLVTPKLANPLKMVDKLTKYPRSRLNLWLIKNMINNFITMKKVPPTRILEEKPSTLIEGEDALPRDSWKNLLNCFIGDEVNSASKLINIMYIGYLKNKNESPEGNTDFQLIEKTLEEELKLDLTQLERSMGEIPKGETPKGKQFDKEFIMHGCTLMEKKLEKTLGLEWKDFIGEKIKENLAESMTATIASLKASSSLSHESEPKKASLGDPKTAMRIKVIEAISKKLNEFGINPFTHLESFMNHIELHSKGVIADLFKKQQHGGLREIYVLTIESRVVQLFIEVISRTICSYFDEETLTHPKNKLRKLNEHRKLSARIAQKRNCLSVDLCSSNDKTRWNQNFVMPAMIIPLVRMTPEYFHPAIMRILNMWTNKLIKIPQSVLILLLNRVELTSDTFQDLSDLFWDPRSGHPIFSNQAESCLRLQTGMMQGILHYTSSLLHLSFLHSANKIIPTILRTWYEDYSFYMTQICSSDDSATILSVFGPIHSVKIDNSFIKVSCHSSLALEALSQICPYYCMQESKKSTTSLIDYVEFNSEFMFGNTIAMPVIKFVSAALNLSESESFLERFYTQYNLISDLFASGFSAEHTHICQIAQAMLHYKTMGSSSNALFSTWCDLIKQWPDPKYGFFLLDVELMPGVLGFSYPHWNACTKTNIFSGSIRLLNQEPWVTTQEGGIVQTLIIKHGEVIRWKRLVERVKGDLDIRDSIESDPSLLFRKPETIDELRIKLAIQATLPGVAKSMRRGNPFMQSFAMSVYAINTHSFSKTTVTQDYSGRRKFTEKVCILGELERLTKTSLGKDDNIGEALSLAFPNKEKYEDLLVLIDQLRKGELIRCHRFRERKTEVVVQPRGSQLPLGLLQVLKTRWFGYPIRASYKIYKKCLDTYKLTIPWIRDTISDTLAESPFVTYQELYNFVSSTIEKTRVFRRNGPALHSRRLNGQIYHLIRKSQRPCHILLETTERKMRRANIGTMKDLITRVNLSLSIPDKDAREHYVKTTLEKSEVLYDDLSTISGMIRRDATLAYIQGVVRKDFTLQDVAIHMQENGMGTHVSYVKEQRKLESAEGIKWIGEGQCYLFSEGCQIRVTMVDDILIKLEVDNWKRLKSNTYNLNQVIKELGLKHLGDSSTPYRIVAKYNGTHLISPKGVGTPVFPLEPYKRIKFDPRGLILKIEQNGIKISQQIFSRDKTLLFEVCMLKYKMNHNDINLISKGVDRVELWEAWVNQSSCCIETMFGLVKNAVKDQKTRLFRWMQETLQSRLQFRNLGSTALRLYDPVITYEENIPGTTFSSEEAEQAEELMNLIVSGKGGLEGTKFESIMPFQPTATTAEDWAIIVEEEKEEEELKAIEALTHLGLTEPADLWINYIRNWEDVTAESTSSVLGPTYSSFLSVHPLWDSVIDGFTKELSSFWIEVQDGRLPYRFEEPASDFMKLLGISPRPISERRPGILERFQMVRPIVSRVVDDEPLEATVSPREGDDISQVAVDPLQEPEDEEEDFIDFDL